MRHLGGGSDPRRLVGRLVRAGYAAGRAVRVVDGGHDRASVLQAFAVGLALPAWFGHNLDALADALRDLADEQGRVSELVWTPDPALPELDPRTYAAVLAVLRDVEAERTDLTVCVVADPPSGAAPSGALPGQAPGPTPGPTPEPDSDSDSGAGPHGPDD